MELVHFTLRYGEVTRALRVTREVLDNPKPVLRVFARYLTAQIKLFMAAEGEGAWPPWSAATRKKYEQTGTSRITIRGAVRGDRVARLAKAMKKTTTAISKQGYTPALRKRLQRLQKQVETLAKAQRKVQREAYGKRKTGEKQSTRRKLLGRLPGSVRAKIREGGVLTVYSAAQALGYVHNAGEGNPRREFIRVTEPDLDHLVELLETAVVDAWEKG